jgi:hypothetical protein
MISSSCPSWLLFGRRLFVGAVAAYLLASLGLGGSAAARPFFYLLSVGWAALLLVGHLGCPQWPWARNSYRPVRSLLRILELVGFNLAFALMLGEVCLRVLAAGGGGSAWVSNRLDAYRLVPGQDYGAGLHGNRLGYPGDEFQIDKPPGLTRIAALGDSFAVGPAVPFADNFLCLLQNTLPRTEVYNFGVSGTGPREYLAILRQHVWTYQPDVVLLCLFVGNDITESLPTPRHLEPRQHALYILLTRTMRFLGDRSRQGERAASAGAERLTAGTLSEENFRDVEARRLAVCLQHPSASLERKWQRSLGWLDQIVHQCSQHQVPLAVVLIPDEFQVNPAVLADTLTAAPWQREDLDIELPQRRLGAFFAERGVPCLDLLPAFQGVPATYAVRDTHWNLRGNRLAANCLSWWVMESQAAHWPRK